MTSPSPSRVESRLLNVAVELKQNPGSTKIAYVARDFIQCTLPHRDPGDVSIWRRINGGLTLTLRPWKEGATGRGLYPYGAVPRLLLYWLFTRAIQEKERRFYIGDNLSIFLREIGLNPPKREEAGGATWLGSEIKCIGYSGQRFYLSTNSCWKGRKARAEPEVISVWNPTLNPIQTHSTDSLS